MSVLFTFLTVGNSKGLGCLLTPMKLANLILSLNLQFLTGGLTADYISEPIQWTLILGESIPRQVDKKVQGSPRREGSGILKEEERTNFFFPLHSLGLYNNNVSCLRTVSGKTFWLILLS